MLGKIIFIGKITIEMPFIFTILFTKFKIIPAYVGNTPNP